MINNNNINNNKNNKNYDDNNNTINDSLTDHNRSIMNRIVTVTQVQRDILFLLLDVYASWTAKIDCGREIQINAAQATGSLA